ncbi:MAG: T9SS type A sorting domain-containing protein [Paludibacter sp.]
MKRIFTFAIALMSMFAMQQKASALVYVAEVPAGTLACYIAGDFPAPMSWAPSAPEGKMTKVDATHYTIDLPTATAAMAYKYCSGPDWAFVEKQADGTELAANRTYAAGVTDVVLKWAAIYDPTVLPLPMNVTIDVITPPGTIECYIVGTFNKWAGPTAPADSVKMVKLATNPDGTVIFEKTIFTDDANKLAYHFCSGPDWTFEQKAPAGDYKYPEVAPTVTEWKKIYDPTKLGNFNIKITVPSGTTEVWVCGSFQAWSMDNAVACTKNLDGTFSFAVNNSPGFEYKLFNKKDASWGYFAIDALGVAIANTVLSFPTDLTTNVTVFAWKIPTGINDVKAATNRMYSDNSTIIVEGVKSQISLFDIAGRLIQSENMNGIFTSNKLKAGMYIIRVDGATRKMGVK